MAQSLHAVLLGHSIEPPLGIPDHRVGSHVVHDGTTIFTVAYDRPGRGSRVLGDSIRILSLRRDHATWSYTALPRRPSALAGGGAERTLGSLVGLRRVDGYLYLETHLTPSAGTIVVLTEDLEQIAVLPGWVRAFGPDGFLVFQRGSVHFAAVRGDELWAFDATTRRARIVYPSRPWGPVRVGFIEEVERAFARLGESWFRIHNEPADPERFASSFQGPVTFDGSGDRITFVVRFGDPVAGPPGVPVIDVVVRCRKVRSRPVCSEEVRDTTVVGPA